MRSNLVSLRCTIERGAFSGERIFSFRLANGEEYRSLASVSYCQDEKGKPLAQNEPQPEGKIMGLVKAIKVKKERANMVVEVPDGQLVMVSKEICYGKI